MWYVRTDVGKISRASALSTCTELTGGRWAAAVNLVSATCYYGEHADRRMQNLDANTRPVYIMLIGRLQLGQPFHPQKVQQQTREMFNSYKYGLPFGWKCKDRLFIHMYTEMAIIYPSILVCTRLAYPEAVNLSKKLFFICAAVATTGSAAAANPQEHSQKGQHRQQNIELVSLLLLLLTLRLPTASTTATLLLVMVCAHIDGNIGTVFI